MYELDVNKQTIKSARIVGFINKILCILKDTVYSTQKDTILLINDSVCQYSPGNFILDENAVEKKEY
jgi:hypothetical protein